MSYSLILTPGYLPQDGELITNDILRKIAQPSVALSGGAGTSALADGSVTTSKFAPGALAATSLGRAVVANGFLTTPMFDTTGPAFPNSTAGRAMFSPGWLTLALIGSGIFTATPAGRAPFAGGLMTAALHQPDAYWYAAAGGTGAAYTVAFNPTLASYLNAGGTQAYTAYWDGLVVAFKTPAACAASATLDAGLGVKGIYRQDGTAVLAGDILNNSIIEVRYNVSLASGAGGWQMTTPPAPALMPFYRAGVITYSGTTQTFAFSSAVPNTSFAVLLTPASNLAGAGVLPAVTGLSTAGFTLSTTGSYATIAYYYQAVPLL